MLVGGSLSYLAITHLNYGIGPFIIGFGGSWVLGEMLFGKHLIGKTDMKAIALGVASGLAFPAIGFALSALIAFARP